jgi:chromosome partitioning protein
MILTIGHTKGGVGKSTLAWHLAHSFHDKKVAIIDLDFQQTLHYINLMGDSRLNLIQPKNSDELIDFLTMTASRYDFVLIDVGGFDSDINRTALSYSDKILIPVSDSITEVLGFMTFKEILKEISTSADFYIVLNNIHPLTKNFETIKEAIADTNIILLDTVIRSRKIYKTTMGHGISVFDTPRGEQARCEIIGIRDELISPA